MPSSWRLPASSGGWCLWGSPKTTGLGEPGNRVFKLKTSKNVREKLKEFYNMLTSFIQLVEIPKSTLRYRREWENSFLQVIHNHLATGKWLRPKKRKKRKNRRKRVKRKSGKPIPRRPPFLLTVRFILQSRERRGRTDAPVVDLRARGKLCPFCGAEGRENGHRVFKCPSCGAIWDRDRAAIANLVLRYLRGLHKEECQDADSLRLADALLAWLKRHSSFLLRT
jgi:hypothetical protein